MVSQLNVGTPARDIGYEICQYIAGGIAALASGGTAAVKIGTVPAGAVITQINSRVQTAITGGTPVLGLGTAAANQSIQNVMSEAAGSEIVFPLAAVVMPLAVDTDIWASITGGATAGQAYIAVGFIKPVA